MRAATVSGLVSSFIETAKIVDVDIETYRLSVVTQFTQKILVGLSFSTPYQHYANGEGVYFMPEVGSLCWMATPSDGSRPFILAWMPARENNDSLRSNKMLLNPGDIYLGTRDENFMILRRGGVVQIGGGPLSQRMFIPINNTIRDFCENYGLHTLGGDLEWTIDREEATRDGSRPAHFRVKAREYANDEQPIAVLEIGSHSDNSANILSLVINASGKKGAAKKISLAFQKDGSATWAFLGEVNWSVKESLHVSVEQNLSLLAKQAMAIEGASVQVKAKTGAIELAASQQVTAGPMLSVAGGNLPALLADPTFLTWLLTHGHPGNNQPPSTQPAGTKHISKKLFAK